MAVRLHMKLGVVAEHDRLGDSPDTVIVVEPSVGSVARSKGNLYLLVTSRISSRHALEATRLAAETIRNEYYYDESAGIRQCLQKAIATANKRLTHQADRLGLKSNDGNGPIGVGVAVVRGREMYVATVGPAEAYLIRQARLSTLPDPHRERGLPSGALEPEVWRGEISSADSLVLISPRVVAKLGVDELKDAMLTLHPQPAMEHLHRRYVEADGTGSDGAIAFEAAEVSSTSKARTLVPVRPAEPLAGAPDRSPIPLVDNVQAAGVAMGAATDTARTAAGGALVRGLTRVQDFMPRRKPAYRRVTPLATRRDTQRRAALAFLALVIVVGGLGLGVYAFGGATPPAAISSINEGQKALDQAKADLAKVSGPGIDLVADDPGKALQLLTDAHRQLDAAASANVAASVIGPLRKQAEAGLDRLYGVVTVTSRNLYTFKAGDAGPVDLATIVRGPDENPYVLDRTTKAVYRVNLKTRDATLVVKSGTKIKAGTVATPRYLAVGGQDLLIFDSKNSLWRWRPSDDTGAGTLTKMTLDGSASLGDDILGIDTFLRPGTRGLYNLYIVDPSEQQIRSYTPANDGSGFPDKWSGWLATSRDVSKMTSTYVDGDLFAADGGSLVRFVGGKNEGWTAKEPKDSLLRPAPAYSIVAAGTARRDGNVYGFDRPNSRLIGVTKVDGKYVGQYRLADGQADWSDMRGMYVIADGTGSPATVVWLSRDGVNQAILVGAGGSGPSPSASAGPAGSASPSVGPSQGTAKPSKKP